jgi:hypothetical protein
MTLSPSSSPSKSEILITRYPKEEEKRDREDLRKGIERI